MSQYEVWCPSCNVTFAPGTKTCIHCGGRTSKERVHVRMRDVGAGAPMGSPEELIILQDDAGEGAADESSVGRSLLRSGMSLVWIVLLVAASAWRVCSGEGG